MVGAAIGCAYELDDWYKSNEIEPVVADADDYITSKQYARHLAEEVGLDPEQVAFRWSTTAEENSERVGDILYNIQDTLVKSKGPEADRAAKNVDLDAVRKA